MRSGAVASAELVHNPAVTDSPVILVPSRTGTTTRSSCTWRWTLDTRLAFNTSGASPPCSKYLIASPMLTSDSISVSLTCDSPSRWERAPSRAIFSCPSTVKLLSRNQRTSAAPSPSTNPSASADSAASILRQSVTAPRTSRSTASKSSSNARRSLASMRSVSR